MRTRIAISKRVSLGALMLVALALASPVIPAAELELVVNGDFSAGQSPWWTTSSITPAVGGGVLEAVVGEGTTNPWDAILGQGGIPLSTGATYTYRFEAWASAPATVSALIQLDAPPFTSYFFTPVALTTTPQTFTYTFTSVVDDPRAVIQFQVGGHGAYTVFLDNVSLTRPATSAPPSRLGELVRNGLFKGGQVSPWWTTASISPAVTYGRLEATVLSGGSNPWDAIVGQGGIPVFAGASYTLKLKAWASAEVTVNAILQKDGPPFTHYFSTPLQLTPTPKSFTFTFTTADEDPAATLQLQMGGQGAFVFYLDNVSLGGPQPVSAMPTLELLANGAFDAGTAPWWTSNVAATAAGGVFQGTVTSGGSNPWDAIIGYNNVPVLAGGRYMLRFQAWADRELSVTVLLQRNGPPFDQYFNSRIALTTTPQLFTFPFTSPAEDQAATFQFQVGGNGTFVFYIDDVSLVGPRPLPVVELPTVVRTNQNGYLMGAPKAATVAVEVPTPQPWTLYDASDHPVASGQTTVFGPDAPSGEHLHTLDFSSLHTAGRGYTIEVYGERSHPFDVGDRVYDQLRRDALAYFFHNRSGIVIAMPFAGDPQWARPAGHLNVSPNQGDLGVPCFDQVDLNGRQWTGCNYTLDVTRGWYDAGDHGKYVVNAGISTWTLLNLYERALYLNLPDLVALRDGTLNIPENHNQVPDVLDEARWEIEFLLSMQVPSGGTVEGVPLAGMAHHKVHDGNWTGLAVGPHEDPQPRYLYPPSTSATLNLAAVAAQCARVWRAIDTSFSQRCLAAAETAWEAALAHPDMRAAEAFAGGGGYGDADVSDEFYWAAAELFVTTGKPRYDGFMKGSPHFLSVPGNVDPTTGVVYGSAMGWPTTQALGTISLAVVPSPLSRPDFRTARQNVLRIANGYLAALRREPYGVPYVSAGGYYWGSNSAILNNMIIMGLAYDFSRDTRYVRAVSQGMDYILGRNPNVKSFVAGYGERPLQNPHHRFWAHQANASFPPPAPGALAGGPNQGLDDPYARSYFATGCAPQACYVDNIESYSTNEVAINWNAPLAWAAAFLNGASALQGRVQGQ